MHAALSRTKIISLIKPAQERLQQKLEKQEMLQAAKQAKKDRGKSKLCTFVQYIVFICTVQCIHLYGTVYTFVR